jgi:hypothetical protein
MIRPSPSSISGTSGSSQGLSDYVAIVPQTQILNQTFTMEVMEEDWVTHKLNPDIVVSRLRKCQIDNSELNKLASGKMLGKIPLTIGPWDKANETAKGKVLAFWNRLKYLEFINAEPHRDELAKLIGAVTAEMEYTANLKKKSHQDAPTASEMYRLAYLMQDSKCTSTWTLTRLPLNNRLAYENQVNYYDQLAEFFNSGECEGERFAFRNLACEYDEEGKQLKKPAEPTGQYLGDPVPISFNRIFERVKDLDPNVFYNDRTGTWIKENSQVIRAWLNKNYGENVGFNKSGNVSV